MFDPWCHPKDLELRDGTPLQSGISHWSCKNHTHAQFACLLLSHPQTRMSLVIWVTAMGRLACNVLSLQGTVLLKPTSLATSIDIPLKSLTFLWLLFVHVWWSSSCTTSTVRFGSFTFLTSPPLFLLYVHSSIFPPDLASLTAAFVGFPPTNRLHLPIIFSSLDPCFLYVSISGFLVFYSLLWLWDLNDILVLL